MENDFDIIMYTYAYNYVALPWIYIFKFERRNILEKSLTGLFSQALLALSSATRNRVSIMLHTVVQT